MATYYVAPAFPFLTIFALSFALAAAALLTHVVLQRWLAGVQKRLMPGQPHDGEARYSRFINIMAYLTAVVTVFVLGVIYYHAGKLLPFGALANIALLAALLAEVKGVLLREPLMNYVVMRERKMPRPCLSVLLRYADKWAANAVLAAGLVLFFPVRGW